MILTNNVAVVVVFVCVYVYGRGDLPFCFEFGAFMNGDPLCRRGCSICGILFMVSRYGPVKYMSFVAKADEGGVLYGIVCAICIQWVSVSQWCVEYMQHVFPYSR